MSTAADEAQEAGGREERGTPGWGRRLWDQFGWLVLALVLAFTIRGYVIEPYRIPSGSMLPTLLIGDHLFVNKFVYGVQLPGVEGRHLVLRPPRRGDIIVFSVARDPTALRPDRSVRPVDLRPDLPRDRFVKRIVGLPGDVIEVREGQVAVNGEPLPLEDTGDTFEDESGRALRVLREQLGSCTHLILDDPGRRGPEGRFVVDEGRYFVMGDNRDHSNDSRTWGTLRLEEVKGPAFLLYWSWDWNGRWSELLSPATWWENLTQRTRWSRIGRRIDCGGEALTRAATQPAAPLGAH